MRAVQGVNFIGHHAPGAWPIGTRVAKIHSAPGDTHPDGAQARVIGSAGPADGRFGYMVVWDDLPGVPVFVDGARLQAENVS